MQRLPYGFAAVLSIISLTTMPACNGKQGDSKADSAKSADGDKADAAAEAGANQADEGAAEGAAASGADKAEGGAAEAGAAEAGSAEAGSAEAGGGETGAGETGAGETGAGETGEESPVPGLFEEVKSLDTDDAAAKKALADALAAGASKLDAAKIANERGEALLTKGESERAEVFFTWARDTHKLFADPVYNLAKLAAYAGDLEIAKEHLAELQKRGNKKLMKKVGVEPAFAPLHDDPDVRKIYEQ